MNAPSSVDEKQLREQYLQLRTGGKDRGLTVLAMLECNGKANKDRCTLSNAYR